MSRISSRVPVFAFTRTVKTEDRVALYRGVEPVSFEVGSVQPKQVNESVVGLLAERNAVKNGDWVIISKGGHNNVHGGTNTMNIVRVGATVN